MGVFFDSFIFYISKLNYYYSISNNNYKTE